MKRRIIEIDEKKCNGCGLCAAACHEGAIAMADGKARLTREDYCDGLGDCLPTCPSGAISFVEREAPAYDRAAVQKNKGHAGGCPGSRPQAMRREAAIEGAQPAVTELAQWPVQIKLTPARAPYFDDAHLLIAADCAAYAYGDFHREFMRNRITLIGCPKLDSVDYAEKLAAILTENDVKSLTVVRLEVPCCGGIEQAAVRALQASGKFIPWQVVTLSTDGKKLDR